MKFTDKTICDAIRLSWKIAHASDNQNTLIRRWMIVYHELNGYHDLLNWSTESDEDRKLFNELVEDIKLLRILAEFHAYGV